MINKILNKIINTLATRRDCNKDMYNTTIYKSGLKELLNEYKGILENSNQIDNSGRKLKEIQFHLDILNKSISDSI